MTLLVLALLSQTMNLNKVPPQRVTGLDGGGVGVVLPGGQTGAFGEVLGVQAMPVLAVTHARNGIAYAERIGGTNEQKLKHAIGASILSDKGVNGRQDWTDAQHRVAVEAELHRGSP